MANQKKYTLNELGAKVDKICDNLTTLANLVSVLSKTVLDLSKTVENLSIKVDEGFKRIDGDIRRLDNKIDNVNNNITERLDYIVTENRLVDLPKNNFKNQPLFYLSL